MSMAEAARYVTAFNRAAEALGRRTRAVALPVTVRYQGDPQPGQPLGTVPGRLCSSDGSEQIPKPTGCNPWA